MTPIPDEWSVDVQGPNIIVAFADGDETGRRILSRHQARVMREQLRLAYLLAGRNRLAKDATAIPAEVEDSSVSGVRAHPATLHGPAPRPTVPAGEAADSSKVLEQMREEDRGRVGDDSEKDIAEGDSGLSRLQAIERTSGILTGAFRTSEEAAESGHEADGAAETAKKRSILPERWEIRERGKSIYFGASECG